jgi:hypothetical protein
MLRRWLIDYGAYVELMQTNHAPQADVPIEIDGMVSHAGVEVPAQDLRAICRAILGLDEFYAEIKACTINPSRK